ncbi:Arginine biosynthesis bifunctional protein ArgJ, mitochondrial [Vermiconidia calcicola]|uniref:Arginine biosynthesis bifunctional protein ArgJ, mitochondrial n=1 Tax=Vermiconidia calcicola TaxID=1690605 RepID=A0ACC3N7B4_9PEZI|nr:Arginine biosynthesis bifunctional protein ArgJ, mitochondrial [Vermiconidia calcicola]
MALQNSSMKRLFSTAFQVRFYSAPAERSIPAAKQKYVPTSGTYPKGFLAGSSHAGVKPSNTKYDDVALVISEEPCPAAGVFTRNAFKAAPVTFCQKLLHSNDEKVRGVVANAGCANAVTGPIGRQHAVDMARATDECFDKTAEGRTLVMSTGVIGQKLPIDRIKEAIPKAHAALGSTHQYWMSAARAICTTDTFPKLMSRKFILPSQPDVEYSMAGMTKGAGMIHPNMGTLLGIICTDVKIDAKSMHRYLSAAANRSFNSISIDGDTSTNDTVAFLANGAAAPSAAAPLTLSNQGEHANSDSKAFMQVLTDFMTDLAKLVVRDGEGATKFVTIRVKSARSAYTARRAASSIATSPLVKTALYGKDANWGRILCAIGYAPGIIRNPGLGLRAEGPPEEKRSNGPPKTHAQVSMQSTSVSFVPSDGSEELKLLTLGEPAEVDEVRAKEILEMEELEILVNLDDDPDKKSRHMHEAVYWTCDFSHDLKLDRIVRL